MAKCIKTAYIFMIIAVVGIVKAFELSPPVLAASSLQPVTIVHLTPSETGQFQRALTSLANQAHVALVAEGVPFNSKLATAKIPDLTAGIPLDRAVSEIAAAYDYDTQRQGKVFILTKRYADSHDLPSVTLEECRQAADNLSNVLDVFNPDFATSISASGPDGRRDSVVSFFQSLSPTQLQAVQSKTLNYGSLSSSQQTLIQNLFLYQYVQMPLNKVKDIVSYLDYASKSAIKVRNQDGYSGLFMEVPNLYAGAPPALLSLTGGLTPLSQTQPSMTRVLPISANHVLSDSITLGKIVLGLKPVNGKLPAIDASLTDKTVTVAGIDNVGSMAILNAVSVLYGLDLEVAPMVRPRLKPHYVHLPASLGEIDAAVWASLPVSYARALHIAAPSTIAKSNPQAVATQDFQNQMRSMQIPADFQQEANNRLLLAIQPQLKKQGLNVRVTVSTLDSDTKASLAVSLMTELITILHNGFSGSPHQNVLDCLGNMNQTIIYTVKGEDAQINNQDIPSIYLEGIDPYTKQKVGLGGVRYFSNVH